MADIVACGVVHHGLKVLDAGRVEAFRHLEPFLGPIVVADDPEAVAADRERPVRPDVGAAVEGKADISDPRTARGDGAPCHAQAAARGGSGVKLMTGLPSAAI